MSKEQEEEIIMAKKSKRIEIDDFINALSKFKGKYDIDIQGVQFVHPYCSTIGDFTFDQLFDQFDVIGMPDEMTFHRVILIKKEDNAKIEEESLKEYKDALLVALQKRKQYIYQKFKSLSRDKPNITDELLNNIAETCNESFFNRLQEGEKEFEEEINYKDFMGL